MTNYGFKLDGITIIGDGDTKEEAWLDALEGFRDNAFQNHDICDAGVEVKD